MSKKATEANRADLQKRYEGRYGENFLCNPETISRVIDDINRAFTSYVNMGMRTQKDADRNMLEGIRIGLIKARTAAA